MHVYVCIPQNFDIYWKYKAQNISLCEKEYLRKIFFISVALSSLLSSLTSDEARKQLKAVTSEVSILL